MTDGDGTKHIESDDDLFRALIATAVDGIMVINERAAVLVYNNACAGLFGYAPEEVLGCNVKMLMPQPYHAEHDSYVRNYVGTGERHIIGIGREVVGKRKDGSTFPMYLSVGEGRLGGQRIFVGIVHDLTGQRARDVRIQELQSELLHIARVTAMGQMSAAIAHELNQPLTAILAYASAVRRMLQAPGFDFGQVQGILDKTVNETSRAGEIIRRLRAFVEKSEPSRTIENLDVLIQETFAMCARAAEEANIVLTRTTDPALPAVHIEKIQIQQVLLNLIRNAIEAMSEATTRQLAISAMLDGERHIVVGVADSGHGLSAEIMDRLFEPFATTKPDGMGMGLNICRTIIEAHQGRIWTEANPAGGTVFRFRLPIEDPLD